MTPNTASTTARRDEITQTRAHLGDTIEALAAKTDVKTRAKDAVHDVTDRTKAKARDVRHQAHDMAAAATGRVADAGTTVGGQVRSNATAVKESIADGDIVAAARNPLTIPALAVAAALAGLVIYLVRKRSG